MNNHGARFIEMDGGDPRDEMLDRLVAFMVANHRGRRLRRRVTGVVGVVGVGALFMGGVYLRRDSIRSDTTVTAAPHSTQFLEIIETDPTTLRRFAPQQSRRTQFIDDKTLARILSSIDRPASIVHDGVHRRSNAPETDPETGI